MIRTSEQLKEIERFIKKLKPPSHCIYCEGIDEKIENPKHHPSYEITMKCNLKCVFCYSRIAEYVKPGYYGDLNAKAVTISQFGEPFVAGSDEVVRVIRGLRDVLGDVRIDIQTNGTLMDPEKVKGEADIVMISLDAAESRKYAEITKANFFDKVVENIGKLAGDVRTVVRTVYIPGVNDSEISGIARIAAEHDCELFLQPLSVYRENVELLRMLDMDGVESVGEYIEAAFHVSSICDVRIPGCILLNLRRLLREYEIGEVMLLRRNVFGNMPEIRREWRFEL